MVPYQVPGRQAVDGLTRQHGRFTNVNRDTDGTACSRSTPPRRASSSGHPGQNWNASHQSYDGGRNDGFVKASGPIAMRFWDKRDLPFTYSLVKHFPIGAALLLLGAGARPTPTAASSSPAPPRASSPTNGVTFQRPGEERHDLRPARRAPHRLPDLLPEPTELADRPRRAQAAQRPGRPPAQVLHVPRRRGRGPAAGSSRSSTPTTTRPPRRTRRTSRSASGSSPTSSAR